MPLYDEDDNYDHSTQITLLLWQFFPHFTALHFCALLVIVNNITTASATARIKFTKKTAVITSYTIQIYLIRQKNSVSKLLKNKQLIASQKLWLNRYLPDELRWFCLVGMATVSVAMWLDETVFPANFSVLSAVLLYTYCCNTKANLHRYLHLFLCLLVHD